MAGRVLRKLVFSPFGRLFSLLAGRDIAVTASASLCHVPTGFGGDRGPPYPAVAPRPKCLDDTGPEAKTARHILDGGAKDDHDGECRLTT